MPEIALKIITKEFDGMTKTVLRKSVNNLTHIGLDSVLCMLSAAQLLKVMKGGGEGKRTRDEEEEGEMEGEDMKHL